MKKLHKLLMTTTAIVSIFGWNIHSTQAQIPTNENLRKGQSLFEKRVIPSKRVKW